MAYAIALNHIDIDMALAERVIKQSVSVNDSPITFNDILSAVASEYSISEDAILGQARQKNIAEARQTVAYLTQKIIKMPAQRIGKHLGDRKHSTILHSCTQAEKKLNEDKEYANRITEIENTLTHK